jgi:hypothetical protein
MSFDLNGMGKLQPVSTQMVGIPPYLKRQGYRRFGDLDGYRVFVFVALEGDGRYSFVAFETESTVRLGEHLHIVAVTATPILDEKLLDWGKSYVYNIAFDAKKPEGFKSLIDEDVVGDIEDIAYPGHRLPGLVLPPIRLAGRIF